jgi:hypothetical protein
MIVGRYKPTHISISDQAQIIVNNNLFTNEYPYNFPTGNTSTLNISPNSNNIIPFIVGNNATIAGILNILTDSLTTLQLDDELILFDIGNTQSGNFDNFAENNITAYYNNLALRITYVGGDGNDISLIATATPKLGDANDDGLINEQDLIAIQQYLGTNSIFGDANFDGIVNQQDIITYQNAIPEPTTLITLLALTPLLTKRKHKN